MSNARTTVATLNTRLNGLEESVNRLVGLLEAKQPAKATRKAPAKKAAAKRTRKARTAKVTVTQGAQAYGSGGLTRRQWNNTVSAKLRLSGKVTKGANKGQSFYSLAVQDADAWTEVRNLRLAGFTPDQAVAQVVANA